MKSWCCFLLTNSHMDSGSFKVSSECLCRVLSNRNGGKAFAEIGSKKHLCVCMHMIVFADSILRCYYRCSLYQIPSQVSPSQCQDGYVFLGVPTEDPLQAVGTSAPKKKDHGRNHDTMDLPGVSKRTGQSPSS